LAQVEHEQLIEIFDPSSVHTRTEHLPPWQVAVNDTIAYACMLPLARSLRHACLFSPSLSQPRSPFA
jgi:hypothetical protein